MPHRVARTLLPTLSIAVLILFGTQSASSSVDRSARLYPDLQTLAPSGFKIEWNGPDKYLRFNNEIGNDATGPLELFPVEGDCNGNGDPDDDRYAYQQLYRDTNANGQFDRGTDQPTKPILAGCFIFHPEHNHWHFEDFSEYQLKRMSDGKVVRTADKISFCIIDTARRFPDVPGSPAHSYYNQCTASSTNGLSVGWSDIYPNYLPGQEINITTLPDGQYCYVSTADPDNRIVETNNADNAASTVIQITGNAVSNLGTSC